MQSVKTKNTGPERLVRRLLYAAGYRYRLHVARLPGKPDLVFPGRRKVIFIHGCFWHSHGCSKGRPPKSKLDYWGPKLEANRARDAAQRKRLEEEGWSVLTVWQCETRNVAKLDELLTAFLGDSTNPIDSRTAAS